MSVITDCNADKIHGIASLIAQEMTNQEHSVDRWNAPHDKLNQTIAPRLCVRA